MMLLMFSMILVSISLYAETETLDLSQNSNTINEQFQNIENYKSEPINSQDISEQSHVTEANGVESPLQNNTSNDQLINEDNTYYQKVLISLSNLPEEKFYKEAMIMYPLYSGKNKIFIDTLKEIWDMRFRKANNQPLETPLAEYLHATLGDEDPEKLCERLRKADKLTQQKSIKQDNPENPSFLDGLQIPLGVVTGIATFALYAKFSK